MDEIDHFGVKLAPLEADRTPNTIPAGRWPQCPTTTVQSAKVAATLWTRGARRGQAGADGGSLASPSV